MTNHYELLYLVGANYTEEELEPIKQKIAEEVKKFSGQITLEDNLGKKKLAYPISKNHQGYYLLYEFDLEGSKLKDLNRNLGLTSELLRHIIVKKNPSKKPTTRTTIAKPKVDEKTGEEKQAMTDKPAIEKISEEDDRTKLQDLDQKLDQILDGDIM